MYFYDEVKPLEIVEKNEEMLKYNKIVNNMDAELVYQFEANAFDAEEGNEYNEKNKCQTLFNLYRITDRNVNELKSIIKKDDTLGSEIPAGTNTQVSYAATLTTRVTPETINDRKAWKYNKEYANDYYSVIDPRTLIVARNYPSPFCDYANALLRKQEKDLIPQIQLIENNDGVKTVMSLTKYGDVNKMLTDSVVKIYLDENVNKKTIAEIEKEQGQ